MTVHRLSHIGICVSDLEASLSFYTRGLGFEEVHRLSVDGEDAARLLGLERVVLEAVYLERDGTCIELLHYPQPGHVGPSEPQPMNRLGLTHLSIRVLDLDVAVERLEAAGAIVLRDSEIRQPSYGMGAVFVTDPDGTRVELVQAPGDPDRLPGA